MPSDGRKGRVRPPETRRDRGETDAESMAWKSPHDSGPWHGIRNAHGQYGSRSRTGVGRRQIGVSMVKRARVGVTARTMDEPIKWVRIALLAAGLSALLAAPVSASSRIKDIASFEGIRDNLLIGYGLVVGLNGTGDTLNNAIFTYGVGLKRRYPQQPIFDRPIGRLGRGLGFRPWQPTSSTTLLRPCCNEHMLPARVARSCMLVGAARLCDVTDSADDAAIEGHQAGGIRGDA